MIDGESRRADIVLETKLKGEDTVLIIHVEPQSYTQPEFNERMYHYFSLLYNRYRKPILPIAVFSYDENKNEQDEFTIKFPFFKVLTFNFLKLEVRKMNCREYIDSNNPVAAALLSKMNFSMKERVQVRLEFLRMMTRMELNPAKTRLIYGFFEQYLTLEKREEEQLMENIKQLDEAEKIFELPISWEEKGKEEGREEGKLEEKRNIAHAMLSKGLPEELIKEVTGLSKEEMEKVKQEA
ncbi:hypothetical protein [Virgibacillus indicus]|uniref:hypothetical protein n=1 Tax=Virgibacillus indicus TaxID=2024554 RepID=UPI001F0A7E15|nr:hypothetical protein [Virgibacillus indicus]